MDTTENEYKKESMGRFVYYPENGMDKGILYDMLNNSYGTWDGERISSVAKELLAARVEVNYLRRENEKIFKKLDTSIKLLQEFLIMDSADIICARANGVGHMGIDEGVVRGNQAISEYIEDINRFLSNINEE